MTNRIDANTPWVSVRGKNGIQYVKGNREGNYIAVFKNVDGFNTYATGWTFGGYIDGSEIEDDSLGRNPTAKELRNSIDRQINDWIPQNLDGDDKLGGSERETAPTGETVSEANTAVTGLGNPYPRGAHEKWLPPSESLAVAVADYKDSQPGGYGDKTPTKAKKKAVTEGGTLSRKPKYHKRSGRGKKGMKG